MVVFIMPINTDYENMLLFTELPVAETRSAHLRRIYDQGNEQTV